MKVPKKQSGKQLIIYKPTVNVLVKAGKNKVKSSTRGDKVKRLTRREEKPKKTVASPPWSFIKTLRIIIYLVLWRAEGKEVTISWLSLYI